MARSEEGYDIMRVSYNESLPQWGVEACGSDMDALSPTVLYRNYAQESRLRACG